MVPPEGDGTGTGYNTYKSTMELQRCQRRQETNETNQATPPFPVSNFTGNLSLSAIENSFQTIPIRTDGGWNWGQRMSLRGFNETNCPIIQEIRQYELSDNLLTNQTMTQIRESLVAFLVEEDSDVIFDDQGNIISMAPPIITNLKD